MAQAQLLLALLAWPTGNMCSHRSRSDSGLRSRAFLPALPSLYSPRARRDGPLACDLIRCALEYESPVFLLCRHPQTLPAILLEPEVLAGFWKGAEESRGPSSARSSCSSGSHCPPASMDGSLQLPRGLSADLACGSPPCFSALSSGPSLSVVASSAPVLHEILSVIDHYIVSS